jgi:hypothetical protein
MSRIPSMLVKGLEPWMSQVISPNTVMKVFTVTKRTPKINPAGGRDHWPNCWTVNFAGGGVKGGEVIGKSDDIGGYPTERPVAPKEIVATIYQAMGIDLTTELPGPQSRPYPVVDFGTQAIKELFA